LEFACEFEGQMGHRRRRQVGCAAQQPGHLRRDRVQRLARGDPRRQALGVGGKAWHRAIPAAGQRASLHVIDLFGEVRVLPAVGGKLGLPCAMRQPAALAEVRAEVRLHALRDRELRVRIEAVELLGQAHLVDAERLAVGLPGILLVRCAVADVALHDHQRRAVAGGAEGL
jgi:hypothetical protein